MFNFLKNLWRGAIEEGYLEFYQMPTPSKSATKKRAAKIAAAKARMGKRWLLAKAVPRIEDPVKLRRVK